MDKLEKNKKVDNENFLFHKTGNIGELLKAGLNSNINLDMSRLSSKGFSNLLEKAKKLQELKNSKGKNNLDKKKQEFDSIYKKGKENLKKNNISLMKIPDNFEILKKFSQRMSNNKIPNNNIKKNDILNYTEVKDSFKDENYNGINTISNTNEKSINFNNEKTNTKENEDIGLYENKKEKGKESIDNNKNTITNNPNIQKRKYFQFYNIFNNLSSKSNKKERFKLRLNKNKNNPISNEHNEEEKDNNCINNSNDFNNNSNNSYNEKVSPSIEYERENYLTSRDNLNKESENLKKITQILQKDNNVIKSNSNSNNNSFNQNNIYEKEDKSNSIKNHEENNENENSFNLNNIYEKQDVERISRKINDENSNNSFNLNNIYENKEDNNNSINLNNFYENDNNIYEKDSNKINNNEENNNSFNLNNIYQKENNDNYNNFNKNYIYEKLEKNNDNFNNLKDENNNNYYLQENNILNLENGEESDDENNDNNDIQSKAMEYETVNSNYSIKQCSTVIEYSFREDINVSYCSLMEDKSKSIENFNNNKNQMLFQLFDGFKGEEVSNFLQQNFTHIYKQYLDETEGNIPRSLVKSFKEIDEEIRKLPKFDGKSSTGTIVHIIWENRNKLMVYCGNVGNSRVSLVSPAYIIKLSQDQITPETKNKNFLYKLKKDNNNSLKKQLDDKEGKKGKIFGNYNLKEDEEEKENGSVYKKYNSFKYRKEKNEMNKIKKDITEEENLNCIPFISKMEIDLRIKNQFLFLASDGIWDKVDEIEMQQIIINNRDTEQLCSILIKNALYRDTKDNISIFSIRLT